MGCCVSTEKPSVSAPFQKHKHSLVAPRSDTTESRAPPPSAEEETVKEVLSETPKTKLVQQQQQQQDYRTETAKPVFDKIKDDHHHCENKNKNRNMMESKFSTPVTATAIDNEISEVSEICSLSESVSTTTTRRDEDEEVRQRVSRSPAKLQKNRAYNGDFGGAKRDRMVGMSPTRRSDQSPGRKNSASFRSVQTREPGQPMARRGSRTEAQRRDPGECSGRRSRSPATRVENGANRSVMGRSQSSRRTNRSPGRVTTGTGTTPQKAEQSNENPMGGKWPSTNESIENPLVSLECFIFL